MSFFDSLTQLPDDPILGIPILFAADHNPKKVNLGIGSYKDSEGNPYILESVKKAEESIVNKERNKDYLPIEGEARYLEAVKELILGKEFLNSFPGGIFAVQSLGGTGAFRLGGEFLCEEISKTIFLPSPTWPNHKPIFSLGGMKIHFYRYYDDTRHRIDFAGMCVDINEMPPGSTILLQVCCHNPTGMDLSFDQWEELSHLIKKQRLIPFFDLAYQGFKNSVNDDIAPLHLFAQEGHELLVSCSFSKNFGLYSERVGALLLLTHSKDTARRAGSHFKQLIRGSYSNPPSHGGKVVATILTTPEYHAEWLAELSNMSGRLKEMRQTLTASLQAKKSSKDWSFLERQSGFFSFCGLNEEHVRRLIKDYSIYMPSNGRINIGGLNGSNLDYVVDALLDITAS